MIPRLTYGVARRGYAKVICLNSSSASVVLPLRMKFTARLKSAVAFADGGPPGPNDALPAPCAHGAALETAPALPPGLPPVASPPGAPGLPPLAVAAPPGV